MTNYNLHNQRSKELTTSQVSTGLDRILEERRWLCYLEDKAIGLITNQTGVSGSLKSNKKALLENGIGLKALFAPEHGITGGQKDGEKVDDRVDRHLKLPIYSLYGKREKPTHEMLEGLDLLIFDIQDVGVRCFTYVSTMLYSLEAAAENDIEFIVLDRPNPLTGQVIEGPLLQERFRSFVGAYNLPVRYCLTLGELALFVNREAGIDANIKIAKLSGWKRDMWFDETGLPWVMPSPNLPTLQTALVYPGTVFFEGTNISEGRGTTRPFELIGAPWLDGAKAIDALYEEFERTSIEGLLLRKAYFIPTFSKHMGTPCHGFQLHVVDRDVYTPVAAGVVCLKVLHDQNQDAFQWCQDERGGFRIDRLTGTDAVRKMIDQGVSSKEILDRMREGMTSFVERSTFYHLYE